MLPAIARRRRVADRVRGPGCRTGARSTVVTRYWLLVIAGLGIFCGCVGKSAQFPLHVWLPDAMEGPTPVSALVHSATMVAAGVYLVGRFYPVFAPEVLLVIAYIGCITLFLAATIAIAAIDIKRVLAYSTVSQLGYMMLALGVGGWLAGLFHLITHAFFKSLLFMCSGSVIHACHTNDMTQDGRPAAEDAVDRLHDARRLPGDRRGRHSVRRSASAATTRRTRSSPRRSAFSDSEPACTAGCSSLAAGGAAITAFYMFRLWFMTFAGKPRDQHVYEHAHESPPVMYVPLVILAVFAVGVGWPLPVGLSVRACWSRPGRPARDRRRRAAGRRCTTRTSTLRTRRLSHVRPRWSPSPRRLAGFVLATLFYGVAVLDPEEVRRQFGPIYRFLWHKWYFDELYDVLFVQPAHVRCRG